MMNAELLPLLISGIVGGVPALLTVAFVYGRLSERVRANGAGMESIEKRVQEHLENPGVHVSEDSRVRDAESRAEVRARLTSIEHKLDLMVMGRKGDT